MVTNILFIVLQSTSVKTLSNGAQQKDWLKALFNTNPAKQARFKIAIGHVPPYAVLDPRVGFKYSAIINEEQVGMPDGLVDLLMNFKVNLLVVGHSHAPYPAVLTRSSDNRRLSILSMPCMHAPRQLLGKKELSPRGFAVLKIQDDNKFTLSVHDGFTGEMIPYTYFPKLIPTEGSAVVYRLLPEALYRR